MEPINTNPASGCELVAADEALYEICTDIVETQATKIDSTEKNKIITHDVGLGLSRAAVLAVDPNAPQDVVVIGHDDRQARELAGASYRKAQDELVKSNEAGSVAGASDTYVFNPGELFYNYWQGSANFDKAECVTGEKSTDDLEDNSTLNTDLNSCSALLELDGSVKLLYPMAQYVPVTTTHTKKNVVSNPSEEKDVPVLGGSNLYLQFMSGQLSLSQLNNNDADNLEPLPTETAELGVQVPVKEGDMFKGIPWGGPTAGVLYSHTADGSFTAGSERFLLGAVIGYKQPVYRFTLGSFNISPYITPALMAGYSQAKLNFGQGYIPDAEDAMVAGGRVQAGVEVSKTEWGSVSVFGAYQLDQTVVGGPQHSSQGASVGASLTINF